MRELLVSRSLREQPEGIQELAVGKHFVVEVGSSGLAGCPDQADEDRQGDDQPLQHPR